VHRLLRAAGWVVAVAGGALAVALLVPDRLGLTATTPVVQVIAFRGVLSPAFAAAGLVLLAFAGAAAAARRRATRDRPGLRARRRSPGLAAPVAALGGVLLVVGLAHGAVAAARGVRNAPPAVGAGAPGGLTVLAANTQGGAARPAAVAAVALATGADVLSLPETTPDLAADVADLLGRRGVPVQVFTNGPGVPSTHAIALLVRDSLGGYRQVPLPRRLSAVRAEPLDGTGPSLVAVHPRAPVPGEVAEWAHQVSAAVALCRATPGAVVAGDFNATLDHAPFHELAPCVDAASARGWRGAGAFGTWHRALPPLLATPIDHVLADGGAWDVADVGVVRVGGSDHRAVVARLLPRDVDVRAA
jgi:endonuclease/exonuclease/phosphatase (EEP) superfamily protein YafD